MIRSPGIIDEAQSARPMLWKVISVGSGTCVVQQVRNDAGDTIARTNRTVKYLPDNAPLGGDYGQVIYRADGYRFFFRRPTQHNLIELGFSHRFIAWDTFPGTYWYRLQAPSTISDKQFLVIKFSQVLNPPVAGVTPYGFLNTWILSGPTGVGYGLILTIGFGGPTLGTNFALGAKPWFIKENFVLGSLTYTDYVNLSKDEGIFQFRYSGGFQQGDQFTAGQTLQIYETLATSISLSWGLPYYGVAFVPNHSAGSLSYGDIQVTAQSTLATYNEYWGITTNTMLEA